jgi:hypothetical protein
MILGDIKVFFRNKDWMRYMDNTINALSFLLMSIFPILLLLQLALWFTTKYENYKQYRFEKLMIRAETT